VFHHLHGIFPHFEIFAGAAGFVTGEMRARTASRASRRFSAIAVFKSAQRC
jgi:hypothetical protein